MLSIAGAVFVIAKLYTGRGSATPIRAALHEQPLVALLGLAGAGIGILVALYPREFVAARHWLNPRWVLRERKGEAILLAMSSLLALGLLEIGSRALYAHDEKLPFFFPPEYLVYPPLYHAMRDYDPNARNVLLLGGSVMYGAGRNGVMEKNLGPPWRVYNLAQNAQCSLDAITKYRWLTAHGYEFDYVVFYEAINETRLNNVPPELFRDDYTHYLFYRLVRNVFTDERPRARLALHSALIFRIDRLISQLRETRTFGRRFVGIGYPREEWLKYGAEKKTVPSYRMNVRAIANLAQSEGARLISAAFAYDPRLDQGKVPDDFTKEWGLPAPVRSGIGVHNMEMRRAIPFSFFSTNDFQHSNYFIDPCHFTPEAETKFIRFWVDILKWISVGRDRFNWAGAEQVAPGVQYVQYAHVETQIHPSPRPLQIHAMRIDTTQPGLHFYTTAPHSEWIGNLHETRRTTTRDFMREARAAGLNMVAAINADAFEPWPAPFAQRNLSDLRGLAVADGELVSPPLEDGASFVVYTDGRVAIERIVHNVNNIDVAISGFAIVLEDGVVSGTDKRLAPRTGIGVSKDGRYVCFIVIDGRRHASPGATTPEVGRWLRHFGAHNGVNLDGGGSATMVRYEASAMIDGVVLLNSPVGDGTDWTKRHPAEERERYTPTERANGNNLGVYLTD